MEERRKEPLLWYSPRLRRIRAASLKNWPNWKFIELAPRKKINTVLSRGEAQTPRISRLLFAVFWQQQCKGWTHFPARTDLILIVVRILFVRPDAQRSAPLTTTTIKIYIHPWPNKHHSPQAAKSRSRYVSGSLFFLIFLYKFRLISLASYS